MALPEISQHEDQVHRTARTAVRNALRRGILVRPAACQSNEPTHSGPIEAHHASYARADWLRVTWLCRRCHRIEDERIAFGDGSHECGPRGRSWTRKGGPAPDERKR